MANTSKLLSLPFLICWIYSCICISSCAISQQKPLQNFGQDSFKIRESIRLAEIDNLGRIYIVNNKNIIINYKQDFKEQYRYADTKIGAVSSIDVSNPLKITIFYDDFNKVKIIDNTLTVIRELNLSENFSDITACGTANDGNLWIYDPIQFKLLKINESGEKLVETSNVNDFGMQNVHITDVREKSNIVATVDRDNGFYFFDNLGQYLFHYPVKGIKSFQFDGTRIIYYTDTGLHIFTLKWKETSILTLPKAINTSTVNTILVHNNDAFIIHDNGLDVQALNY